MLNMSKTWILTQNRILHQMPRWIRLCKFAATVQLRVISKETTASITVTQGFNLCVVKMSLRFWSGVRYYVYPLDNTVSPFILPKGMRSALMLEDRLSMAHLQERAWPCAQLLQLSQFVKPRYRNAHTYMHAYRYECIHMHTLDPADGLVQGSLVTAKCFLRESSH